MHFSFRSFSTSLVLAMTGMGPAWAAGPDFEKEIRPLLNRHCLECHGQEKQRGGLRLDVKTAALKGGDEHGSAFVPGEAGKSAAFLLASSKEKEARMPPRGPGLTEAELLTLKQWINAGAVWPESGDEANADPAKSHWAFQPLRLSPHTVRSAPNPARLDGYIEGRLTAAGLVRSPEADRRTLLRRLSFDVTGLPPSPEEMAAFVSDPDPLAYEKQVERLLASPRYGERWARHWLDVVRFAESDGYEKNTPRPNAWPYRDYVIRALNEDLPYNRFILEQLAGDTCGVDEATGFIVGGPTDTVKSPDPILTAQQRADDLHDMVSTTGSTFLGLTVGCARCHSHKFDPISHTDYHALVAMFAGVRHGSRPLPPKNDSGRQMKLADLQNQLMPVVAELRAFEPVARTEGRTVIIPPDDARRVSLLKHANARRTKYEAGTARGEVGYEGGVTDLPTVADGYLVWLRDNAAGEVAAWQPGVQGRFRIWVSWGSGYKSHDEDARYLLDMDGDPATSHDRREIAQADHRKFADGTGTMPNRKLWSGFKDIGIHDLEERSRLTLAVGGDSGYPTADLVVLQEEPAPPSRPALRLPVRTGANVERFPPIPARHVRFTITATTQGQPCLDELEVFTAGDAPRNVALASAGAQVSTSSSLPGHAIHQPGHPIDGQYGNNRSWISNEPGRGRIEIMLPQTETIDRVVWSRDRTEPPAYHDRLPTSYHVETSQDGLTWTTVARSDDRLPHHLQITTATLASSSNLPPDSAARLKELQHRRQQLARELAAAAALPTAYSGVMGPPGEIRRYQRGDVSQPREVVAPGVITTLRGLPPLAKDTPDPERRLALARWITDPANPLTARVMANRVWHYHFGTGLVDTPSDFGLNGGRPTHPELLDWLAAELVNSGWSLKHLHRTILLSATYRQSSTPPHLQKGLAADAQSRLLWRFPPRRLEAEVLRDTMLAVSGKLDLRMGGPGFDLFEPNTNYVKVYNSKDRFSNEDFRRMIYQHKPRVQLDNVFGAFDCPDAGQITPRRNVSTTPLQALSLLNSTFAVEQARFFAARLAPVGGAAETAVHRAFMLAFNRPPGPVENAAAIKLVESHGLEALCRALFNANEFIQIF